MIVRQAAARRLRPGRDEWFIMRFIAIICPALLALFDPGPATRPTTSSPASAPSASMPASEPTSRSAADLVSPEIRAKVDRLVGELASAEFTVREKAQQQLAAMGEAAMLPLMKHVNCPDLEVAERVSTLIVRPSNPEIRIEVAYSLLATGKSHLMEPAVYMLFREPLVDCEKFAARVQTSSGLARAVCDPVLEQLKTWKMQTEIFRRNYERFLKTKPDAAEQQARLHEGSEIYAAEAAFWQAVDAAHDFYSPPPPRPASPTTSPAPPPGR
jgi:hypothetical protein